MKLDVETYSVYYLICPKKPGSRTELRGSQLIFHDITAICQGFVRVLPGFCPDITSICQRGRQSARGRVSFFAAGVDDFLVDKLPA